MTQISNQLKYEIDNNKTFRGFGGMTSIVVSRAISRISGALGFEHRISTDSISDTICRGSLGISLRGRL